MKKFLGIFWGVFYGALTQYAMAADKFDILPDLPDTLTSTLPAAQATSVSGADMSGILSHQSIGHEPNLISLVFSLLFVILLIYITGIIYAKLNKVGFNTLKKQMGEIAKTKPQILSTTNLGSNRTLHVIEIDGRKLLIGASLNSIQLIKDLTAEDNTPVNNYKEVLTETFEIPDIPQTGFTQTSADILPEPEQIPENDCDIHISDEPLNFDNGEDEYSYRETPITEEKTEENFEAQNPETSEGIINSLFIKDETKTVMPKIEHKVDQDEYALYKKYL